MFTKQYKVFEANHLEALEETINEKLQEGWKLHGGITMGKNEYDSTIYLQAMYKRVWKN